MNRLALAAGLSLFGLGLIGGMCMAALFGAKFTHGIITPVFPIGLIVSLGCIALGAIYIASAFPVAKKEEPAKPEA